MPTSFFFLDDSLPIMSNSLQLATNLVLLIKLLRYFCYYTEIHYIIHLLYTPINYLYFIKAIDCSFYRFITVMNQLSSFFKLFPRK